jgi:hypothetical protein
MRLRMRVQKQQQQQAASQPASHREQQKHMPQRKTVQISVLRRRLKSFVATPAGARAARRTRAHSMPVA